MLPSVQGPEAGRAGGVGKANNLLVAFDGLLPIWAKHDDSDLWESVPKKYWKDHQIFYLNVIREDSTTATRLQTRRTGPIQFHGIG